MVQRLLEAVADLPRILATATALKRLVRERVTHVRSGADAQKVEEIQRLDRALFRRLALDVTQRFVERMGEPAERSATRAYLARTPCDVSLAVVSKSPIVRARAYHYCGVVAEAKGDRRAAAEWFERSTSVLPMYAASWYRLGLVYLSLQEVEEARACFEQAREIDPGDTRSSRGLAQLLRDDDGGLSAHYFGRVAASWRKLFYGSAYDALKSEVVRLGEYRGFFFVYLLNADCFVAHTLMLRESDLKDLEKGARPSRLVAGLLYARLRWRSLGRSAARADVSRKRREYQSNSLLRRALLIFPFEEMALSWRRASRHACKAVDLFGPLRRVLLRWGRASRHARKAVDLFRLLHRVLLRWRRTTWDAVNSIDISGPLRRVLLRWVRAKQHKFNLILVGRDLRTLTDAVELAMAGAIESKPLRSRTPQILRHGRTASKSKDADQYRVPAGG